MDVTWSCLGRGQQDKLTVPGIGGAGFGSRMLAKWGFEGQGAGLGREGQGRAEPIAATMRPKKLGLGATKAG